MHAEVGRTSTAEPRGQVGPSPREAKLAIASRRHSTARWTRRPLPLAWKISAVALMAVCTSATISGEAAAADAHLTAPSGTSIAFASSTVHTSSSPPPVYEVRTGTVHGLGKVLVNGQGFTLYVFAPDKRSGSSKCYGNCANAWPPLVLPNGVSKAPAGPGVRNKLLGTTKRTDGSLEVTYDKWPLYGWVVDSEPGEATGQDLNNLGGKWYVITPSGALITKRK